MSWLNFNEGLNSLKGQLTNLAQSVLTEDDNECIYINIFCSKYFIYIVLGSVLRPNDFDELRKICLQQEQEVRNVAMLLLVIF